MAYFRIITTDGKLGAAPYTVSTPGFLRVYQTEKETIWAVLEAQPAKVFVLDSNEAQCVLVNLQS